jgi:hypothetical protein
MVTYKLAKTNNFLRYLRFYQYCLGGFTSADMLCYSTITEYGQFDPEDVKIALHRIISDTQ